MKYIKYIFAILLVYMYIYSPALQVMSFGIDKVVFVGSIFYIVLTKDCKTYLSLFVKDFKFLALIAFFSLFVFVIHYSGELLMYDLFLLIEPIPVACALYVLLEKKTNIDIRDVVFLSGSIAGIISVVLLLNPSLTMYLKTSVLRVPEVLTTFFSFRGLGFADGLLNSYPTAQGLILGLLIIGFFEYRKLYFLLAIPIFISVVVNARTGVVPILVGLVLLFILGNSEGGRWGVLLGVSAAIVVFVVAMNKMSFTSEAEESINWGKSTIDLLAGIFKGEEVENQEALTKTMVFFPDSIEAWLLGTGYNVFSKSVNGSTSDIGYIIRLWYGGVFYLLIMLIYAMYMCRRIGKINKAIGWLMFLSFIAFNYKTDFLTMAPCGRLFFLVYVVVVCSCFDAKQIKANCH